MSQVRVRAYMRIAVLAVVLLAACGSASGTKAQASLPPSASPTQIAVTPAPSPMPTAGPLTWSAPLRIDHQPPFAGNLVEGVSCPSVGLCVAVDQVGDVVTSNNPAGGAAAWTVTHVDNTKDPISEATNLGAVSCPTTGLCIAVDISGNVVTSSNPTGGATAWALTKVDGSNQLVSVSCPSTNLCVAGDTYGN